MSPRFSIVAVLLGVLCCPMAVSGTERPVPIAGTTEQSAPKVTDGRTVHDDATQVRPVVLPRKYSTVDLSRLPLPLNFGPLVIGAYHIFPAQEPGPYVGPPTRIWGLGFGTSLWRDPVTGWPET